MNKSRVKRKTSACDMRTKFKRPKKSRLSGISARDKHFAMRIESRAFAFVRPFSGQMVVGEAYFVIAIQTPLGAGTLRVTFVYGGGKTRNVDKPPFAAVTIMFLAASKVVSWRPR